jgi:hypothetical protein
MELLPAIGALLVTLQRRAHRITKSISYNDAKISKRLKKWAYGLLFLTVPVSFMAFPFLQLLCIFYNPHEAPAWLVHGLYRIFEESLIIFLFGIVWLSYRQPKKAALLSDPEQNHSDFFKSCNQKLSSFFKFAIDLPDLAIMVISGRFTVVVEIVKLCMHIIAYIYYIIEMKNLSTAQFIAHDIASLIQVTSFFVQYRLIRTFLTFDNDSMMKLNSDKFVVHFAPAALAINVLRYREIYLNNANYLPRYLTQNVVYDNVLSLLASAYPGSLLFSMTAALCWAHIVERLYKTGAYTINYPWRRNT